MQAWGIVLFVSMIGCSGADFSTAPGGGDAAGEDSTIDAILTDTTSSDVTVLDSSSGDVASDGSHVAAPPPPVDAGPCVPFWCGCGVCTPKDIACTHDTTLGCPLGCPAAPCPATEMPGVCTNVGDRCQRNGIDGEIACYHTADCPPGKCCKNATSPPGHGTCVSAPDPSCLE
jgi:hypothetical protein